MKPSRLILPGQPSAVTTKKFFVVAGNRIEYNEFIDEADIPERYAVCVSALRHVHGFSRAPRFHVVYVGHYWDNPVWDDWRATLQLLVLGLDDHEEDLSEAQKKALLELYPALHALMDQTVQAVRDEQVAVGDAPLSD
jgi:hypothetical protein